MTGTPSSPCCSRRGRRPSRQGSAVCPQRSLECTCAALAKQSEQAPHAATAALVAAPRLQPPLFLRDIPRDTARLKAATTTERPMAATEAQLKQTPAGTSALADSTSLSSRRATRLLGAQPNAPAARPSSGNVVLSEEFRRISR